MFRRFEATRYITRSVSPEKKLPNYIFSLLHIKRYHIISNKYWGYSMSLHSAGAVSDHNTIYQTLREQNLIPHFSVTQPHRLRDNGQQPIIYIDTQTSPIVLLQGKCRVLWGWDRIRWTMNAGAELRICACTHLERLQTLRRESDD